MVDFLRVCMLELKSRVFVYGCMDVAFAMLSAFAVSAMPPCV